jgi:Gliding motility associated protein GldN
MKIVQRTILTLVLIFIITGCQQTKTDVIANKIQYDVNIVSPDPSYDWWIQNLPGPQREKLVNMIMDGALSGKYPAYDYYNKPLTVDQLKEIMSDTVSYTVMDKEPPYEKHDTTVINNIMREDIKRIRFLEEWKVNPETMQIEKRILGIAPIAKRPDLMGMERWQPLFWIYTDKEYVKELKEKQ